jgi:hypothetical protein
MADFDPNAFYKVTLLRACEILKTEYPANLPFKANGEMVQRFSDAGALAHAEDLDGPEVGVHAAVARTDNHLMLTSENGVAPPPPDNRTVEEAVADLPEPDRIHYLAKITALEEKTAAVQDKGQF